MERQIIKLFVECGYAIEESKAKQIADSFELQGYYDIDDIPAEDFIDTVFVK